MINFPSAVEICTCTGITTGACKHANNRPGGDMQLPMKDFFVLVKLKQIELYRNKGLSPGCLAGLQAEWFDRTELESQD